jgi:hypothetical protein
MGDRVRPASEIVDVAEILRIAGPSIEFRTRTEVLGEPPGSLRCRALQEAILDDPLVRDVFSWQREDGWLGGTFHGSGGIEAGIRILCEKGLSRDHPILARALDALEAGDDRLHLGIGKVGRILDEEGLGGSEMIRAAVFAYAGDEGRARVGDQIEEGLRAFEAVLGVESIDEISAPYKGKRVFRDGVRWPSVYHLRLLAGTHQWRTKERLQAMARAVERMVRLSPIPEIHLKHRSQLIAPASFAMTDFSNDLGATSGYASLLWFVRTELLARLGVVSRVPALEAQVARLAEILEDGLLRRKFGHPSFRDWGAYAGLALETDWRAPSRRIADLTFRALLILHHATA